MMLLAEKLKLICVSLALAIEVRLRTSGEASPTHQTEESSSGSILHAAPTSAGLLEAEPGPREGGCLAPWGTAEQLMHASCLGVFLLSHECLKTY